MPSLNKVLLIGNLTADPEMTFTPSGVAVTKFSLAVNETWKDGNGEKQERVEFFNCEAWNKAAEVINQYVTKGQPLYVEGKLQTDSWDDKTTGEKKYRVKVRVSEFQFLASKPQGEQTAAQAQQPRKDRGFTAQQMSKPRPVVEEDDLEIPF